MRPPGWLLDAEPYAVQVEAWTKSRDRARYGLFLDPGLGKTQLDLATFLYMLHMNRVVAHVVVAPSYLASGWRDEVAKWKVDVPVYTWPDTVPEKVLRSPFIFVTYPEAVITRGGEYVDGLLAGRPCLLTIDESSLMKNPSGRWTKRIMGWKDKVPACRLLTGTPMTQSALDLWAQLRMIGAIPGVNPYQFRNRHCVMGGYLGKQIKGVKNEEELRRILEECSFRARKSEWWSDMPEQVFPAPLRFEMTKSQQKLYDDMRRDFLVELDGGRIVSADQVIHSMLKLQQLSRGFVIDEDGVARDVVPPKDNPSLRVVKSAIETAVGKVIVFAMYRHSCALLGEALREHGVVSLTGGMSEDEIAEVKAKFNGDPATRVIVCQAQVGARGHTLLGGDGDDRCSTTIFAENSYSLELRTQEESRNHRFGQDRAVVYLDLAGSSQDAAIIAALQRKQNVVDSIINTPR